MKFTKPMFLFAIAASFLFGASCGDASTNGQGSAATQDAPTSVATAGDGFYPPGTRTKIPTVDRLLSVLESGSEADLSQLVQFSRQSCISTPQGIGAPPLCQRGEVHGSIVEVFRITACEQGWYRAGSLGDLVKLLTEADPPLRLFALENVQGTVDPDLGSLTYRVVVGSPGSEIAASLSISAEGLKAIRFACGGGVNALKSPNASYEIAPKGS